MGAISFQHQRLLGDFIEKAGAIALPEGGSCLLLMMQTQLERWIVANMHCTKGFAIYATDDDGRRIFMGFPTAHFLSGAKN
jgi:hypothetical protein